MKIICSPIASGKKPLSCHLCCSWLSGNKMSLCLGVLTLTHALCHCNMACFQRVAGASVLIVNGMLMDLQNFDLYSLVDTIRKEVRHQHPSRSYIPTRWHRCWKA